MAERGERVKPHSVLPSSQTLVLLVILCYFLSLLNTINWTKVTGNLESCWEVALNKGWTLPKAQQIIQKSEWQCVRIKRKEGNNWKCDFDGTLSAEIHAFNHFKGYRKNSTEVQNLFLSKNSAVVLGKPQVPFLLTVSSYYWRDRGSGKGREELTYTGHFPRSLFSSLRSGQSIASCHFAFSKSTLHLHTSITLSYWLCLASQRQWRGRSCFGCRIHLFCI